MFHGGMGESETRSNDVDKLRDEDEIKCKKEKINSLHKPKVSESKIQPEGKEVMEE